VFEVYDAIDGWPPASSRVRPGRATTAGVGLIVLGSISVLVWLVLVGLSFAVASALADPSDGGAGLHPTARTYLIITVPVVFYAIQIASGALVLRGAFAGRVLGLVVSGLTVAASLAALVASITIAGHLSVLAVPSVVYAGAYIWSVAALSHAETRLWCRRT
jgi:hypothetical protein